MDIVVWRAASLLLTYPDQRFYDRRPMLRAAVADLPEGPAARRLATFLDHVDRTPPVRLAVDYLQVCRRCSLHLTDYRDALMDYRDVDVRARLSELYRAADCEPAYDEPPDFLPVMLEYAALCADDWLLLEHRPALERLRIALNALGTPYAALVEAVCATLGGMPGHDEDRGRAPVHASVRAPVRASALRGQATFSDEEDDEGLLSEEPDELDEPDDPDEPDEFDELDDSDLAAPSEELEELEESEDSLDEEPFAPAAAGDLPEPRLSVR